MPTIAASTVLNDILPAAALSLWCAMYVIYCWRDPDVRRWLERQVFHMSDGRRHPHGLSSAMPALFRAPPTALTMPASRSSAGTRRASGSAAVATVRVAEWQAGNLPMRYRLLGQVRAAANDN